MSVQKDNPVKTTVDQKITEIHQQMTLGLAGRIADSYVFHIVGANEVTPEHEQRNDGETFLKELFEYSPVKFTEEEKRFLMDRREGGPVMFLPTGSCGYILIKLALLSGAMNEDPNSQENPLSELVNNILFLERYQKPGERACLLY